MPSKKKTPREVFTPNRTVSADMFIDRKEVSMQGKVNVQKLLKNAIEDVGGQVVIYGDSGVGKSSLLEHVAEKCDVAALRLECRSGQTFKEFLEENIANIAETERTVTTEGVAKTKIVVEAGGAHKRERKYTVPLPSLLRTMLEALEKHDAQLLVLDNFQKMTDPKSRKMAFDFMEMLANLTSETDNKKIVIVGIAEDAQSLFGGDISLPRRTKQVGVPRMPLEEIREILYTGFGLLELTVDKQIIEEVVFYADGFPFFAHGLGLNIALEAKENKVTVIGPSSPFLSNALSIAMIDAEQPLKRSVELAVKGFGNNIVGHKRWREFIDILANSEWSDWTSHDVIGAYTKTHGPLKDSRVVYKVLNLLATDDRFGEVLQREKAEHQLYRYRFSNPYFRTLLRINARK